MQHVSPLRALLLASAVIAKAAKLLQRSWHICFDTKVQKDLSKCGHLFVPILFPLDVEVIVQARGLLCKHNVKQRRWRAVMELNTRLRRALSAEHSALHTHLGMLRFLPPRAIAHVLRRWIAKMYLTKGLGWT